MKVNDLYMKGFKEIENLLNVVKVNVESSKDGDIEAIHVTYMPSNDLLEPLRMPPRKAD